MDLIATRFGNVPVLAEEAAHVASRRAHRKNFRSREKMIEWFFLDGIDLDGGGGGIAQAVEFAAAIDANEAEAGLVLPDVAVAGAEVTVDFAGSVAFPPARFVERLGF